MSGPGERAEVEPAVAGGWVDLAGNAVSCSGGGATLAEGAVQRASGGAVCGNGTRETGESCDGTDLGGSTCTSLG